MDSQARTKAGCRLNLLLIALLLTLVTALTALAGAALIAAGTGAVAALVLALAIRQQRQREQAQQRQIETLETSLLDQRVIDPETGATLARWFAQALDTECRRAVREFTPLTLMQFDFQCQDAEQLNTARIRLAEMLNSQISRPGDLLGLTEQCELQLLLPCTNEHAKRLAQRCMEQAEAVLGTQVRVRLAACTLQPTVDLTPDKVRSQLQDVLEEVRDAAPGSYCFRVESAEADLLHQQFTL